MPVRESVKALADLGFTNLEAEIYAFLLQNSPATGYRIAQATGKPAANTYKAIQSLEQKGAVIVDDGASRMCRAVSSDELLSRLSREFESKKTSALASLSHLNGSTSDERIYQIRSKDQLFQRAREMLAEAKKIVVADVSGTFVSELGEDLLAAAARRVDVALKSDQAIRIEGVEAVQVETLALSSPMIHVVVDGEQTLMAVFDATGNLLHAIWSRNPMLAILHHEGIASGITLANLASRIEEGAGQKRLTRTVASHRKASDAPGFARQKAK